MRVTKKGGIALCGTLIFETSLKHKQTSLKLRIGPWYLQNTGPFLLFFFLLNKKKKKKKAKERNRIE